MIKVGIAGFGKIGQGLRAALTGQSDSPGVFDVLVILGEKDSLHRLEIFNTMKIEG